MAQVRTAKGTQSSKTSGTALTISGVAMVAGTTLYVCVAWKDGGNTDKPALKWGNRDLRFVLGSEEVTGDTLIRWYKTRVKKNKTADITATWTNAKNARCMFATQLTEASDKDGQWTRAQTATTNPSTSTPANAPDTTDANTIALAGFAARGPHTDTAATAGSGHTIGQRVGTSGAPPASNITLQETYEALTAVGEVRSQLTLTTARDVCSSIAAWAPTQTYTIGRAYYDPHDANPEQEAVVFVIEDETGNELFQVHIPREEFEVMTDGEVDDYIKNKCQWRADKDFDDAPSPDFTPDSTFNTRVSSFENDTIPV